MKLILASQSPRRYELLSMTGFPFEAVPPPCDEEQVFSRLMRDIPDLDERRLVEKLALAKGMASLKEHPGCLILAADTIVTLDGTVYGKPKDKDDARSMLRTLSGRTHVVDTGVAILTSSSTELFSSVSHVTFQPLSPATEALIDRYAESGLPLDKAGGYGIQERGGLLISHIEGDYFSVMGLPVSEVFRRLSAYEID